MFSGRGFILHTFTVSTKAGEEVPGWSRRPCLPQTAQSTHTLLQGLAFLTVLPVQIELVYPQQGKEEGRGTASGILIAALARKVWEQQPCTTSASETPLLASRRPAEHQESWRFIERARGQIFSTGLGEQDAGCLSQEQLSTLFSRRAGWRCILLPVPISL